MALFGNKTLKGPSYAPKIDRVIVLGIRTAEETRVMATYNSTMYSLIVVYEDGTRELIECSSKEMTNYIYYVDRQKDIF